MSFRDFLCYQGSGLSPPLLGFQVAVWLPDDDDDAVKDVVRVSQVVEEPEGSQLQDHLQGEHAGEDDITDLQNVGQLLGLWGVG